MTVAPRSGRSRYSPSQCSFLYIAPPPGNYSTKVCEGGRGKLAVSFLAEPAPIVQDGSTRLVYEMQIVNFANSAYVLDAVEAKAGAARSAFSGAELEPMIARLGDWGKPATAASRTIEAGRGVIVFLMLDLGKSEAPGAIEHSLRVLDDKGGAHEVALAPLPVSSERSIVVAPPLRGEWIAGNSANNRPDAALFSQYCCRR